MSLNRIVFQGVEDTRHIDVLEDMLAIEGAEKVYACVAFANRAGAEKFLTMIAHADVSAQVVVGIGNSVTTHQALRVLVKSDIPTYVVDTGSASLVFHPKIYLVKGAHQARLLIGSANLTLGGLGNNFEASALVDFKLDHEKDYADISSLISLIESLPIQFPENVRTVSSDAQIAELNERELLIDEDEGPIPQIVGRLRQDHSRTPRIRTAVTNILSRFVGKKEPLATRALSAEENDQPKAVAYSLAWESKPLTERDLNIPMGATTHRTGSMNLDQGRLDPAIDFRHYFYDEVFDDQTWDPNRPGTMRASIRCRMIVNGADRGEYTLRVRHSLSTTSTSYLQRNAMSRLSWEEAIEIVRDASLLGRTLRLYAPNDSHSPFLIMID